MRRSGFSVIELAIIPIVLLLLVAILLPSLMRAREMSKRLVCGANMKGIGTSCKIYANDNNGIWPTPAFNENRIGNIQWESAEIGQPDSAGTSETPGRRAESTGETITLTTTRAYWMMILSGDNVPKQYICPSSGDIPDSDRNMDLVFDFASDRNISYGYQIPYGPEKTRPNNRTLDPRVVVAADKGPFSTGHLTASTLKEAGEKLNDMSGLKEWRILNSPNHRKEGQNVLYADGHVPFEKLPIVGMNEDYIYSRMGILQGNQRAMFEAVRIGLVPADHTYPGMNALGKGKDSSTDSLIYP